MSTPPPPGVMSDTNPPRAVSRAEPDLPEDIQKHLTTFSTLYTDTVGMVWRDQCGAYTRKICNRFQEIRQSYTDFATSLTGFTDERQKKTAVEHLVKTGIIDLLCHVMVKALESGIAPATDHDLTEIPPIASASIFSDTFPLISSEVWCVVLDHDRLLPELVKKVRDWYQPHMDKTLPKLQDELLRRCVEIIRKIAQHDDKGRDRLRQLNTTLVMTPYIKSPDYNEWAALGLGAIVTEDEVDKLAEAGFVTAFCDAAPRLDYGDIEYLVKNGVIRQHLVKNGAVGRLIECVRQASDEKEKEACACSLSLIVWKAEHDPIPESDVRDLVHLALERQNCRGWMISTVRHLVKNDAARQCLIQNGAVRQLVDRVRQVDNDEDRNTVAEIASIIMNVDIQDTSVSFRKRKRSSDSLDENEDSRHSVSPDKDPSQEQSASPSRTDDVSEDHTSCVTSDPATTGGEYSMRDTGATISRLEEQIRQCQETITYLANENRKLQKTKGDLEEEQRKDKTTISRLEQKLKKYKDVVEVHRRHRDEYVRLCQETNREMEQLDSPTGDHSPVIPATEEAADDFQNQATQATNENPLLQNQTCPVTSSAWEASCHNTPR